LGKLVIMDGNPDLGKSLLALDWCARLSTGRPFPDISKGIEPANALVLNAEDAPHDTIVPRLQALGADMSRIFIWRGGSEAEEWPWRFPRQADRLEAALIQTAARLVVIDPLMAFLDERVICVSDSNVRAAMAPLMRIAEKYQCAILMHRHLNKRGGGDALYRGLGSIAFVAACRFAMLVEREPENPRFSVLAAVRHSLAKLPPSLVYQITAADGQPPRITWHGHSPFTANDLLAHAGKGLRAQDEAADFLEHFLVDGPQRFEVIQEAAKEAGIGWRTVERAKKALGIRSQSEYHQGQRATYWLLDGQELGPEQYDSYEIDKVLKDLRRKGVPPTSMGDDED
jgi:hypothetical protein